MSTGARGRHEASGLRASPDGGHEEVDGSAGEERTGFFSATAPNDCHGREDGPASDQSGSGLHQSAQQGGVFSTSTMMD